MDQGIIKTEKVNYKKNVVRRKLDSIENGYEMEPITILDAIEYTDKAWREIKQSTIATVNPRYNERFGRQKLPFVISKFVLWKIHVKGWGKLIIETNSKIKYF